MITIEIGDYDILIYRLNQETSDSGTVDFRIAGVAADELYRVAQFEEPYDIFLDDENIEDWLTDWVNDPTNAARIAVAIDAGEYNDGVANRRQGLRARDKARIWFKDNPGAKQLYKLDPDTVDAAIEGMIAGLNLDDPDTPATPGAVSQLRLLLQALAISSPPLAEASGLLNKTDDDEE